MKMSNQYWEALENHADSLRAECDELKTKISAMEKDKADLKSALQDMLSRFGCDEWESVHDQAAIEQARKILSSGVDLNAVQPLAVKAGPIADPSGDMQ